MRSSLAFPSFLFVAFFLFACGNSARESTTVEEMKAAIRRVEGLVPQPAELELTSGWIEWDGGMRWEISDDWQDESAGWADWIGGAQEVPEPSNALPIEVRRDAAFEDEGYALVVDSTGVLISAGTKEGAFRGLTTLGQLLPATNPFNGEALATGGMLPLVRISDAPNYPHRGLLLDCCRHFMEPEFVKRTIDLLALHKMNVLHWHLTEDQGWRVEIDAYPKLTEVGAWRTEADGTRHGGFYTKEEIREVVAYAAARHVTVIPEIELPGHSRAALAAYPWLSCTGDSLPVENEWGVFKDIYCAGQDTTFEFIEAVLDEVMELFPSEYIHIGGDEAPKVKWEQCPRCQQRIADEGLHDSHELQSWFISRVGRYLAENGRKLIGWDEILDGGLPAGATVQSWRGMEGGERALALGRDAIMSPTSHCYLDYPLRATDLEEVYGFVLEPEETEQGVDVPDLAGDAPTGRILGGEVNMWTERAPQEVVESKVYPRLIGLAEVLWTPNERRSWTDFQRRMDTHYKRLDQWNVDYGMEAIPVEIEVKEDSISGKITLTTLPSIHHLTGTSAFLPENGDSAGPNVPLGSPVVIDGIGQIDFALEHRGRPIEQVDPVFVAAHAASFQPIALVHEVNRYYPGGGTQGLVDSRLGSMDFRDGTWQATWGDNLGATVDLGEITDIERLSIHFYRYQNAWIFLPDVVTFAWSSDSLTWHERRVDWSASGDAEFSEVLDSAPGEGIFELSSSGPIQGRYIRFHAANPGPCPDWHDAPGEPTWLFADEFVVEAAR